MNFYEETINLNKQAWIFTETVCIDQTEKQDFINILLKATQIARKCCQNQKQYETFKRLLTKDI